MWNRLHKFSQEELAEMKDRVMTENEAIEELKYDCNELGKAIPCDTSWGKSLKMLMQWQ